MLYNFARLLEILGIDFEKLKVVNRPIKFMNVILPDESYYQKGLPHYFFTEEYQKFVDKVRNFALKNFSPLEQKNFYFFHGFNKQVGEERIAEYFRSKNYDIIQPERMSLDEQLNILINCKNFASTIGSISHNAMFMKDDTETIFIPRYYDLNEVQFTLNQTAKLKIFYIDSALSIFTQSQHNGPFCYIVSENLRKYFGDEIKEKYTDEDFVTFLTYMKYAKSQGLQENSDEIEYLKDILPEFMAQLKNRTDLLQKFDIL